MAERGGSTRGGMQGVRLLGRRATWAGLPERPDPVRAAATVLSFDFLMGSAGVQFLAIPFILLARRERAASDPIETRGGPTGA